MRSLKPTLLALCLTPAAAFSQDIPEGQELLIQGSSSAGHLTLQREGFLNAGTIRFESIQGGYTSALNITTGALTNGSTGTLLLNQGSGGARLISGDIVNLGAVQDNYTLTLNKPGMVVRNQGQWNVSQGASFNIAGGPVVFRQEGGGLNVLGSTDFDNMRFEYAGGVVNGLVYMVNSELKPSEGSGPGNFLMTGSGSVINGSIFPGQVVTLRGEPRGGHSTFTSNGSFRNRGKISLTSASGGYGSALQIAGQMDNEGEFTTETGSGGGRTLAGSLLNLGAVSLNAGTIFQKQNGMFENRGSFSITSTGSLTMNGLNQVFRQTGGTLKIEGGFSIYNATLEFAGGIMTGSPYLVDSLLAYTGTPAAPGMVMISGGGPAIQGPVPPGQEVWVRGDSIGGNTTLKSATNLVNHGTLRLESVNGGYGTSLSVSGVLSNSSSGVVRVKPGSGGGRTISADLVNEGTVEVGTGLTLSRSNGRYLNSGQWTISPGNTLTIDGQGQEFTQQAGLLQVNGGFNLWNMRFNYRGGAITGSPYLVNSALEIAGDSLSPVSFLVTGGSATIEGDIHQNQLVWVRGDGTGGHATLKSAGGMRNDGTIQVQTASGGWSSSLLVEGTLTNGAGGVIAMNPGSGGGRSFSAELLNFGRVEGNAGFTFNRAGAHHVNRGTFIVAQNQGVSMAGSGQIFEQAAGKLQLQGSLTISDAEFDMTGGEIDGSPYLINSVLKVTGPGRGNFMMTGANSIFRGALFPDQKVWVRGDGTGGHATLNFPDGLKNEGTVTVETASGGWSSSISSPLGVTNGAGGKIIINGGTGGGRSFAAQLVNGGSVEANTSFTLGQANARHENHGSLAVADGATMFISGSGQTFAQVSGTTKGSVQMADARFELLGGDFAGSAYLINSHLHIDPGAAGKGNFLVTGGNSQFSGNINPGQNVWVRGDGTGGHTTLNAAAGFANGGYLRVETASGGWGSSLVVSGVLSNTATGVIEFNPGSGGGRVFTGDFQNEGRFAANTGVSFNKAGAVVLNAGEFFVNNGSVTISGDYIQRAGFTKVVSTLDPAGVVNIAGGALTGGGVVAANTTNSGIVSPGSSPGMLTFSGNFDQTSAGNLEIELGGTEAGISHDQLKVTGAANLAGKLTVRLVNGFTPSGGDTFVVLSAGTLAGDFASFDLPPAGPGMLWQAFASGANYLLKLVPAAASTVHIKGVVKNQAGLGIPNANVSAGMTVLNFSGLRGDYFSGRDFDTYVLSRLDGPVNFNWGGAPATGLPADFFSVRWSGFIRPAYTEEYTFYTSNDDGVRLWVNGQLVIDDWNVHGTQERNGKILLTADTEYEIKLEYFEYNSGAVVQLSWASASRPREIIPADVLRPSSIENLAPRSAINFLASGMTDGDGAYSIEAQPGDWVVSVHGLTPLGYDDPSSKPVTVGSSDVTVDFVAPPYSGQFYDITLESNPPGTGILSGGGRLAAGSAVTVEATPNTANKPWLFVNWTEDGIVQSTDSKLSFVANRNRRLKANFRLPVYTVGAETAPAGAGSVTGAGNYVHDQIVTLRARPNFGFRFENWTDDGQEISRNATLTFAAAGNRVLTANFATTVPEDIVATDVTVPSSILMGQPLQVVFKLGNIGAETASGPWADRFLLRTNLTEGSALVVGSTPFNGFIPAGGSTTVTQALILPQGVAGSYYVTVEADSANAIAESNETNNSAGSLTPVTIQAPDLTVAQVTGTPVSARFGDSITFNFTLRNRGDAAAANSWSDRVELEGPNGRTALLTLGAADVTPLNANGEYERTATVTLPLNSSFAPGEYKLVVTSDAKGDLAESDESNNSASSSVVSLSLPPLPDLVVLDLNAPVQALPGSEIEIQYVLTNAGPGAASLPWRESVSISTDDQPGDDLLIVENASAASLPPGTATVRTNHIRIPVNLAGDLRWVIRADSADNVVESNEGNNLFFSETATTVPLKLTLLLPSAEISENRQPPNFRARVFRSGPVNNALTLAITSSDTNEISGPGEVIIPAGSVSVEFDLAVIADGVVDGPQSVTVTAAAPEMGEGTAGIVVLDSDLPRLTLTSPNPAAVEGQTIALTVTRSNPGTNELVVNLASSSPEMLAPTSVIIPQGSNSVTFTVLAVEDERMEPAKDFGIFAEAPGHIGASITVTALDNDDPGLSLTLEKSVVSESAGGLAISATVTRQKVTDRSILVQLRSDNTGEALAPPTVVIPANVSSAAFYISAVNDLAVDGTKTVNISAYVADSLTKEPASAVAVATVQVTDDDGPALSLLLGGSLAREGKNPAFSGVVRRNTETAAPLTVNLLSSDANEATVPATVTIPAGADSVQFDIVTINDGTSDGNKRVKITASSESFAPAEASLTVTDADLPDLILTEVSAPAANFTKDLAVIGYKIQNQGFDTARGTFVQKVFLSRDTVLDPGDLLLDKTPINGELAIGQTVSRAVSAYLPADTGKYWIFVVVDAENGIRESVEDNNTLLAQQPLTIQPAYQATVETDVVAAPAGTPVPLRGRAFRPDNSPAVGETVAIHIRVAGQKRTIAAITDSEGKFTAMFTPLPFEAGSYEVGATHPGEPDFLIQDRFSLLGMRIEPNYVVQKILPGITVTNELVLRNLSDQPLRGLEVTSGAVEGLDVRVFAPNEIGPGATASVLVTASAPEERDAAGRYLVILKSAEGAVAELTVDYAVELPRPRLLATPHNLKQGMVRGGQTLVNIELSNSGGAPTGPLDITLPDVPWMKSVTTSPMPSLAPGERATVTLQLAPDEQLPLIEYDGRLAIGNLDAMAVVPFVFRNVSDAKGDLAVSVVDEATFYGTNGLKVANASVKVRDVFTSELLFEGTTDAGGVATFTGLAEGAYNIEVTAAKHDTFLKTVHVKPGTLNEETAFIRLQLVRYNWKVEEVDIEEKATIRLETTFETTVPVPVITIEPGVVDLTGVTADEVQYEIKVTNHGLLAAQDMELQFKDGATWSVHPLTDKIGVLPAQSSLTIPVVFRKITEPQSLRRQRFSAWEPSSVEQCSPPTVGVSWNLVCGQFGVAYWSPVVVVDLGICPPPPLGSSKNTVDPLFFLNPFPSPPGPSDPGGPGRRGFPVDIGWGPRGFVGYQGTNDCSCDQNFEAKCFSGELGFKGQLGDYAQKAINGALQSFGWARVLGVEVKFSGAGKLCTCCENGQVGLQAEGELGASIEAKVFLGPSLHFEVPELSVPGLAEASGEFFIGAGAEVTAYGSGKINGKTKCFLTDPEVCINVQIGFKAPIGVKGSADIKGKLPDGTEISAGGEAFGGIEVGANASAQVCINKDGVTGAINGCTDPVTAKVEAEISYETVVAGKTVKQFYKVGASKDLMDQKCINEPQGSPARQSEAELVAEMFGQSSPAALTRQMTRQSQAAAAPAAASTGRDLSDALVAALPKKQIAAQPGQVVFESVIREVSNEPAEKPLARQSEKQICAQVKISIDQEAVVTRKAIRATLELFNESESPLEDVGVTIQIYDGLGQLANDKFIILKPELTELTTVETSEATRAILGGDAMRLGASRTGTARWIILPKDEAAPEESQRYFVGGFITYTSDGIPNTAELIPAPVNVYPNAKLALKYFHQRDVYSDDPATPEREPSIPFVLGVMVQNKGRGLARNFSITSAQPKIVENEKGLLIDFSIVASEVAGKSLAPSLTVNFGDVAPGGIVIGKWLLKSTLQGLFIDYKATLEHEDRFSEKGASVFEGVEIHELIHQVEAPGPFNDGKPDFLANDIADLDSLPDTLHLSDGSVVPVEMVLNAFPDRAPTVNDLEVQLAAAMPSGWACLRIPDPANGQFKLVRVRRSDGVEIPMGVNTWVTDRTFIGLGKPPRKENILHLFDYGSTGNYTLVYARDESVPDMVPPESSVFALPSGSPAEIPVRWSGADDPNGSGIAGFDIFVSIDGGPFVRWLERTRNSSGLYQGAAGHHYAFYSRAVDAAGNVEPMPAAPDAFTVATGNSPPAIAPINDITVDEGALVDVPVTGSDADLPGDTLSYSLVSGPPGVRVDATSGRVTWQTAEQDGPRSHTIVLSVLDNGNPPLSSERSFRVTVREVNQAPAIAVPSGAFSVNEGELLAFTATASDADLPPNALRFRLGAGAPAGASIDAVSGEFRWTPLEQQGGASHTFAIEVHDNSSPDKSVAANVTVTVNKVNAPPTLAAIADRTAYEGDRIVITNTATDTDLPAQSLAYALAPGAPEGAEIDPVTGLFEWIPTETQAGQNVITISVSDDGSPSASAQRSFNVFVTALQPGLNIPRRLTSGEVTFRVKAEAGVRFRLEANDDLGGGNWVGVKDFTMNAPILDINDLSSAAFPWRFFRLKQLP